MDAFQEFYNDVQEGVFPNKKNFVEIDKKELDIFLNSLEKKIKRIENLLNAILVDVAKLNVSLDSVEKNFGDLSRGSCSNTRLCRRKK